PRRAGESLAAAIRGAGAKVVEGAGPQHPDAHRDDVPVIWATGAQGLAALGADLGRLAGSGVKGQSALLEYAAPDAPQVFADGLHVVPHADGTVAVGSTAERDFTDGHSTDDQLEALIGRACAMCPALEGAAVVDRWAGIRPRAVSRAPLLGPWPGRPGHFVANGGFKIGFGMAPAVAGIMADLILTGEDRIPPGFKVG
ncbi:MAG TPA: FAD-dependent oxidoreductase, partial [Paracoccus sp. (in: a-proteobacteria)]|nr:FAD-dependent oxidoreductase [Paracoccus sp. (in: a-proteobacteria)]